MTQRPDLAALVEQLRVQPFLVGLPDAALRELAQGATWREYEQGAVVFLEGEPPQGLYLLLYGWLKIVKSSPDGREQVLQFLEPGTLFNAIGALADHPNPATAITLEPAGLWLLRREAVMAFVDDHPQLARWIIARMAEHMLELVDLVANLSLRTVRQRLARLLLDDADGAILHRPQWLTQAEIAARLGTVPDVIQRALSSLAADDLIKVERDQIVICDRDALERIAG